MIAPSAQLVWKVCPWQFALLGFANCQTDEHIELVELLTGTQKKLKCTKCGAEWLRGEPRPGGQALPSLEEIKKRFPKPEDVDPLKLARASEPTF
ncbi:hypothetical protein [Arthrobacter sp. NPDC057013]|uniref:hypothetical protein n=1 Tax=Arthrobacter sp. NPDC057013 TaxID=3345999 RepID=UPI00363C7746